MRFHSLPLSSIIILPDRQRKDLGDLTELKDSIRRLGLLNPIICTRDNVLIAGERRYRAMSELLADAQLLDLPTEQFTSIDVQYKDELSPTEMQIIELDENIRRQDITWQETADAINKIHKLFLSTNPEWSQHDTAEKLGLGDTTVSRYLRVFAEVENPKTNLKILQAPTLNAAMLVVNRLEERRRADAINALTDSIISESQEDLPLGETPDEIDNPIIAIAAIPSVENTILNASMLEFLPAYSGQRFNFIHCDLPYGINYNGWDNAGDYQGNYDDSPELYWALCNCLIDNWDSIALPSAHLMFWFSMKYYTQTMTLFARKLPQLVLNDFPLIWHKTDNRGTLPDPQRGPRRVYETCLFGATEDRKIVKAISNTYGAPTHKSKAGHISEKPEPVLRHFFQMIVDDQTSIFDPTCGSGSAIRAAESMGAKRSLGIEIDSEFCAEARTRLASSRLLAKANPK